MTLQIFERFEPPGRDPFYRVGGSFVPYCTVAKDKRFTNAELAAESYRQMTRAIAESGMVGAGFDIAPGDAVTFGPVRRETARLGVMKRFATLPHFDEVEE